MKCKFILFVILLLIPSALAINSGDKILAGDKTITLLSIAAGSVRVSVDGQTDVIQQYQQKEVNGISIYVRKIISVTSPTSGKSSAELIIGTDDKTELIYVPYKEPITGIKEAQTKPIEQPIKTEPVVVQQTSQPLQAQPAEKQKPQTFNLFDFLKSIENKLKSYLNPQS